MILLALGQLRRRPAAFAGLAAALFLALATLTLFGSLFAADLTTPAVDRETADGPGLMVIAGAFGEIAVLVAFFVVVNALGFALRRQHRELALLRTIAATPRQVRRLVRGQVTVTTLAMAVPVWPPGRPSGARSDPRTRMVPAAIVLTCWRLRNRAFPGSVAPIRRRCSVPRCCSSRPRCRDRSRRAYSQPCWALRYGYWHPEPGGWPTPTCEDTHGGCHPPWSRSHCSWACPAPH
ncbi:FtsX-like permease family protein [Streptomyces sp. NBC_00209]|uniref:FtsX-like permease family protein n=1 Tax=Streptomyces sp. NBC_00209 TaxID=2975682 RepID=UPI00325590DE